MEPFENNDITASDLAYLFQYILSNKMFKFVISEYDFISRASFTTGLENESVKRPTSNTSEFLS